MKKSILIIDRKKINEIIWETVLSFCTLYEARLLHTELSKEPDIKALSNPTSVICFNWTKEIHKKLKYVKKYRKRFEIIVEEDPFYYSIQDPWKVLNCLNNRRYDISFKTTTEFDISGFLKSHDIDFGVIDLMELSEANIFNDPVKVYIWKIDD